MEIFDGDGVFKISVRTKQELTEVNLTGAVSTYTLRMESAGIVKATNIPFGKPSAASGLHTALRTKVNRPGVFTTRKQLNKEAGAHAPDHVVHRHVRSAVGYVRIASAIPAHST